MCRACLTTRWWTSSASVQKAARSRCWCSEVSEGRSPLIYACCGSKFVLCIVSHEHRWRSGWLGEQVSRPVTLPDLCAHMLKHCKTKQTFAMNLHDAIDKKIIALCLTGCFRSQSSFIDMHSYLFMQMECRGRKKRLGCKVGTIEG